MQISRRITFKLTTEMKGIKRKIIEIDVVLNEE